MEQNTKFENAEDTVKGAADYIELIWKGDRWEVSVYDGNDALVENEEIFNACVPENGKISIVADSTSLFVNYERITLRAPKNEKFHVLISGGEICINMMQKIMP
ncbi:MAG: hypothetical protein GXO25_05685 [Euryarchaeota archaeon]|nr:hypothetical protein [Euryarchaeota archaeon]